MAFSMAWRDADVDGDAGPGGDGGDDLAPGRLAGFRRELYRCLGRRRDALFDLADAVLCRPGRVQMLAELSLGRLIAAGHWRDGDPAMLIVFDAGYDVTRLAWLLADLPVEVLGRLRADRVMQLPAPARQPGTWGRPRKHGGELALADPATWPDPQVTTSTATSRYGMAAASAWDRVHPRRTHRAAWLDHDGDLPVIEGTLIRLQVDHLPGDRDPKPAWLWSSVTGAAPWQVDLLWQVYATKNGPPVIADRYCPPAPRAVAIRVDGRDRFCCGMGNTQH